jgi:eukaryotic-like serine/threonine-protein kinase
MAIRTYVLSAAAKHALAIEAGQQAVLAIEALGGIEEGEVLARVGLAESLRATGRPDEAQRVAAAAVAAIDAAASNIDEPEVRAAFLHGVPENVRARELANGV